MSFGCGTCRGVLFRFVHMARVGVGWRPWLRRADFWRWRTLHYDAFMCPMLICERRVMTTNAYSRDGHEQKNAVVEDADRGIDKKTA